MFSPVFENPFGAILFEAGQLKYSMKILNALEGETFAVQFLGSQDVSVREENGIEWDGIPVLDFPFQDGLVMVLMWAILLFPFPQFFFAVLCCYARPANS